MSINYMNFGYVPPPPPDTGLICHDHIKSPNTTDAGLVLIVASGT